MKITKITTRPLWIPYKRPFHWAHGTVEAAEVILVEVETDEGLVGYGETMSSISANAVEKFLSEVANLCIGESPFDINRLLDIAYRHIFAARGTCSSPRFGALVLAGLDMALWDVVGKAAGRAIHELLGGAVRGHIQYFGFPQGGGG